MDVNQEFEEIANRGIEEYFKRNPRIAVMFGKWIEELKQLDVEKLNFENKISLKAMEYYHNINFFMHEAYPLWKKDPNGLENFQEIIFLLFQRKGPTTGVPETIIAHLTNLLKYLEEFQSRFDDAPIPVVWRDLALKKPQKPLNFCKFLLELLIKH